jgi:hypothetical protein
VQRKIFLYDFVLYPNIKWLRESKTM